MNVRSDLYKLIDKIKSSHSVLDMLINNAETIQRAAAEIYNDILCDEVLEVNQTTPYILNRELGREMVSRIPAGCWCKPTGFTEPIVFCVLRRQTEFMEVYCPLM